MNNLLRKPRETGKTDQRVDQAAADHAVLLAPTAKSTPIVKKMRSKHVALFFQVKYYLTERSNWTELDGMKPCSEHVSSSVQLMRCERWFKIQDSLF